MTPLQGGLPRTKKKNVWEKYINLIYLFNKKCYKKKLFIEVFAYLLAIYAIFCNFFQAIHLQKRSNLF